MGLRFLKSIYSLVYASVAGLSLLMLSVGCSQSTEEVRIGSALIVPVITVNPVVETVSGPVSSGIIDRLPSAAEMNLRISSIDGLYSNTWPSVADYPLREPLRPGSYMVEVLSSNTDEGFDSPYFYGSRRVELQSGDNVTADVECRLANSVFMLEYSSEITGYFQSVGVTLHSAGGGFVSYPVGESRPAYINAGSVSVIMDVTTMSGEQAEFIATTVDNALPGNLYEIDLGLRENASGVPEIVLSFDDRISTDDVVVALTPAFMASEAPELKAIGFDAETAIGITEGDTPSSQVAVSIDGAQAQRLLLTTKARSLIARGWPAEIDLAAADAAMLDAMTALGLQLTRAQDKSITQVDLTNVFAHLRADDIADAFILTATSAQGKIAGPLTLNVNVLPAELSVLSVSDVLMGVDVAQMHVLSRGNDVAANIGVEVRSGADKAWQAAEIMVVEPVPDAAGEWIVRFRVPSMTVTSADVRVTYCGEERARSVIRLVSPDFSLDIDAFAQYMIIKIDPDVAEMLETITSMARIYIDGKETSLIHRVADSGVILVGGLTGNTRYSVAATLYDKPTEVSQFTPAVTVVTEKCLEVPNGSFEEVRTGIRYKDLPAGGRYSQNIVDIFNCQNYASYDQFVPKEWANVNAKTFCRSAANYNTWYMQPSTYSITDAAAGAYAVAIESTSWDLDGEQIADYRQTGQPYIKYSLNIPTIAHRAAGKVFIGEYRFDPVTGTETYDEGIEFTSRPTSLNGYYRFMPAVNATSDAGLAIVELISESDGVETVIAKAEQRLGAATGYTAFSIPLSYSKFGVKATKLKIMFASSVNVGSIEEESANVITYSDPVTSTSHGGCLWIDDLTFSY